MTTFKIISSTGEDVTINPLKFYRRRFDGQVIEQDSSDVVDNTDLIIPGSKSNVRLDQFNTRNIQVLDVKTAAVKTKIDQRRRLTFTHTTNQLGVDEFELFEIPSGTCALVVHLELSSACTIEIHSTAERSDKVPYKFSATDEHLVDDGMTLLSDGSTTMNGPGTIVLTNKESPLASKVYAKILNDQGTPGTFTLTLEYLKLESVDLTTPLEIKISYPQEVKVTTTVPEVTDSAYNSVAFMLMDPEISLFGETAQSFKLNAAQFTGRNYRAYSSGQKNDFGMSYSVYNEIISTTQIDCTYKKVEKLVIDRTPINGVYYLFVGKFADQSPLVTIKLTLGSTNYQFTLQVNNIQTAVGLENVCLAFKIDAGRFVEDPAFITNPIATVPIMAAF